MFPPHHHSSPASPEDPKLISENIIYIHSKTKSLQKPEGGARVRPRLDGVNDII